MIDYDETPRTRILQFIRDEVQECLIPLLLSGDRNLIKHVVESDYDNQQELANFMGCNQSWVSQLINGHPRLAYRGNIYDRVREVVDRTDLMFWFKLLERFPSSDGMTSEEEEMLRATNYDVIMAGPQDRSFSVRQLNHATTKKKMGRPRKSTPQLERKRPLKK